MGLEVAYPDSLTLDAFTTLKKERSSIFESWKAFWLSRYQAFSDLASSTVARKTGVW